MSPGFILGKASGLSRGSGASSPRSANDSLPMITRQDPGWLRRCPNQNPASMETGSAAHSTASPLNPCLPVRPVTSAQRCRQRWRALLRRKVRNNAAACFLKGDLSPFYKLAIHIMKRGPVLRVRRPVTCCWKSPMEVIQREGSALNSKFSIPSLLPSHAACKPT